MSVNVSNTVLYCIYCIIDFTPSIKLLRGISSAQKYISPLFYGVPARACQYISSAQVKNNVR